MAAIETEGLVKVYRSRTDEVRALDGVDLEVQEGTVLGLLGPNGAGKTTAVRILATLIRPDSGRALIGGRDVVKEAEAVRRLVGLTGQYASVDEDLTGRENLVMLGKLLDLPTPRARSRAEALDEAFGFDEDGHGVLPGVWVWGRTRWVRRRTWTTIEARADSPRTRGCHARSGRRNRRQPASSSGGSGLACTTVRPDTARVSTT